MEIEFRELGEQLMAAMVEPDPAKRAVAIVAWKKIATGPIESAVRGQIDGLVQELSDIATTVHGEWIPPGKWTKGIINVGMTVRAVMKGYREMPDAESEMATQPPSTDGGDTASPVQTGDPAPRRGGSVIAPAARGPSQGNQRANVKNPNNPAHRAAAGNRSNQMNPNSPAYRSSRSGRR